MQQAWRISHVALDMLAWVSFDKIHRLVRDLKCSVLHAAGGVFLKAQLYSNHIWSVNFRPWGTGLFASVKKRLLNLAMVLLNHRDEIFWSKYYGAAVEHGFRLR